MNESTSKKEKPYPRFLVRLNQDADAQRKRDEERAKNPVFRGKPKPTERESSIRFWDLHH
jgi:hypothetical protein